ncbi:pilus assembly protein TadG-related protein [Streptomyces sp. NBC_00454]|uniref:pilus assembly protein TadG-related protein n=1 Tax=Streptomyces sp. NBC_00454 TaxID=2975747 RepID=UPI0030E15435
MTTRVEHGRDRGQAFPIYVVMVAGLLFAALAFFVIGQAAVTRSDAQGAADAAALAAAREARDHLVPGVVLVDLRPGDWEDILNGKLFYTAGACTEAMNFAERNGAKATCDPSPLSFSVAVQTDGTVGKSVIPGTETMHGTANATAVIEPRCHLVQPLPADGAAQPGPIKIACKGGKEVTFDPSKPDPWRTLGRSLFDVRLTD